jgi:hypothetical protein
MVAAALLCSQLSWAVQDSSGSEDLAFIERFPQSWIVDYRQQQVPDYSLATGRIKKVDGVIAPDSRQYLSGQLTRITYRIPGGRSSEQVKDHFEQQFQRLKARQMFSCDGRDCGDSNQWANAQFKIARLYGIDREQFYRALHFERQGQSHYLAFYTVKRGNKRVYAQLDLIQTGAAVTAGSSATSSLVTRLVYPDSSHLRQADVDQLKTLLRDEPKLQLLLVGHSQQGQTLSEQQQHAQQLIEQLKRRLIEGGVAAERIQQRSLGGLAPSHDAKLPGERVELLLLPTGYLD